MITIIYIFYCSKDIFQTDNEKTTQKNRQKINIKVNLDNCKFNTTIPLPFSKKKATQEDVQIHSQGYEISSNRYYFISNILAKTMKLLISIVKYSRKGIHVLLVELEIVTAFWGRQSDNPIKIKNTLKKKK